MSELWSFGAGELAGMIAGGKVSSAEVVEAHLARIEEVNPHLNALTVVLADKARRAAAEGRPGPRRRREPRPAARRALHRQAEHRHGRHLHQLGPAGPRRGAAAR